MKKLYFFIAFLFAIPTLSAQDTTLCKQQSKIVLQGLQNDQIEAQMEFYSSALRDALPPAGLKGTWAQLEATSGAFVEAGNFLLIPFDTYLQAVCRLDFENKSYHLKLTFNTSNELEGIFFQPLRRARQFKMEDNAILKEHAITIPSEVNLPGILCMPKGKKNVPVVILVHGSGPQDRDATIGPNKPFKDIALSLASKGIASIRYDKRTYVGKGLNKESITVKEIVIDDVLAVVKFAKSIQDIDTHKLFVMGHSLGAHLTPRILAADTRITGGIMLAGNARPLQDLIFEQYHYLKSQDGLNAEEELELKYLKSQCKNADKAHCKWKSYETKELPLNVPQSFYADLNRYKPLKTAKKLPQPLFIAQGGRDYQVTTADFNLWKKKLKKKNNVQLKLYPSLNHLMMEGEVKSTPKEYEMQSNVSAKMLSDVAEWIWNQK